MRLSSHLSLVESQEPVGLVIADGGLGDHIPRFSAFVWGPVPEEDADVAASHVASVPAAVTAAVPSVPAAAMSPDPVIAVFC